MDLPEDRLATTDKYGDKIHLYTASVKGYWRNHRDWSQSVLILIFLSLPWIHIGGQPAILLSIPERRFAIFGLTFWAHDTPLLFFVGITAAISLALVTAIWGRVWCGWACPQTIFIDGVYRRIENWVEGNHYKRRALDAGPLTLNKVLRKSIKWFLFIIVSLMISHGFAAYFIGADRLLKMSFSVPSQNWTEFIVVFTIAGIVLFDFTWFREQFCIIMCPYGRIQSVLLDRQSKAVMYDEARGEPRKVGLALRSQLKGGKPGDCENCRQCIMVCPTGIDIRNGTQMECINCTACIDACDEIMEKVHKPKGLIRYSSLAEMKAEKPQLFSPRIIFYAILILISTSSLIYLVSTRSALHLQIMRVVGSPFRVLDGPDAGFILNNFKAHVQNHLPDPVKIRFEIQELHKDGRISKSGKITLIEQSPEVQLKPGEIVNHFLFIKFHKDLLAGVSSQELKVVAHVTALRENSEPLEDQFQIIPVLGP